MRQAAAILVGWCFLTAASCLDVAGAAKIGGPMNIDGPLYVHGSLYVGGPATIHGPVFAKDLTVGGPVNTSFPKGEQLGAAGQTYGTSLIVGGPLTVRGPLIVEGTLKIGGPLYCESTQGLSDMPRGVQGYPQQGQVDSQPGQDYSPQTDSSRQPRIVPQQEWTE